MSEYAPGKVGKYNPETGKVEWHDKNDTPRETPFAVHGCVDFLAVGLPNSPRITSRNQYKQLLKRHNAVVVGNDPAARPPTLERIKNHRSVKEIGGHHD